ncbi:sigma 54-interacting transcriptional regulator [Halobacteriovorax sp. HLS]|uniref:sigma 54-interacting transcriptional regulator n=1 Tax=Halobacteriovorax sp. HLS TaxID=2234000 RepID=UPI000FDA046B|nr:sigma 54-interacting transcriptional regulator [Halobacteriovorax sp. HLS]
MLASFSEFKFYQSFRIPVEDADDLRFLCEKYDELGKASYISDAKLVDISVTGLGFSTRERISVGDEITISLQFKRQHLDLSGKIVRAFSDSIEDDEIIYGLEIDAERELNKFLEVYVMSFSTDRLKECLIDSALKEKYTKASEGFEMFSLLLSLFKDITYFGDKEGFLDTMLSEVVRILNAQRASIFLINPETNELEAIGALGVDKDKLKFDYRLGIAGSVFTTGVALNIDIQSDKSRFNDHFDKSFGYETKSIICHPIHNREDKIIGVIQILNKRNQDRFTVEDEKTMKVLALVFSSVFHGFNPMSETSQIRRFSTPFDRKHALIGKTSHVASLRSAILKTKDLDSPLLIQGEKGVGKKLFAKIIHHEGCRGLKGYEVIRCEEPKRDELHKELWGTGEGECVFNRVAGGTVVLHNITALSIDEQRELYSVLSNRKVPGTIVSIDVRVIATADKDLGDLVDKGEFDRDLYEYLSKAFINMEPLRRRIDDIDLLVDYFLKIECKKQGLLLKNFSPKAMEKFKDYDWPGNITELRKCIERAVLYNPKAHIITEVAIDNSASPLLDISVKQRMFGEVPHVTDYKLPLKERVALIEREMILAEIKRNNGNKSKAAKEMGISREALRKKLLQSSQVLETVEGNEDASEKEAA